MTIFIDDVFLIDLDTWKISFKFRIFNLFLKLWQAIIIPCLFLYFVLSLFCFLLRMHFLFGTIDNNAIYREVADEFHINLVITKLKFEANLEACLGVFWSQNWILLAVNIINCFNKFVHIRVFLLLFINRFFCLLKICHIDVKCSKLLLHLN